MVAVILAGVGVVELGWRSPEPGRVVALPDVPMLDHLLAVLRSAPLVHVRDPRAGAVASGVVFGRTEHVDAADQAAFLSSGLWHLLAASGQNVALVAACCIVAARRLGGDRVLGGMLAMVAIPLYVLIVGSGASIVRAGMMGELALVAWLAGRIADPRQVLLASAAIIVWIWPGAHRGLGMQLSYACVLALAWWAVPLTRRIERAGVPAWLAASLAASLLCSTVTAPILTLRTGTTPLLGVVANIVAVPLAGILLVVGLAGSLVACAADAFGWDGVGDAALLPTAWLAGALRTLALRASDWPMAQTAARTIGIGIPLVVGAAVVGGRARPRWARRIVTIAVVACCGMVLASCTPVARIIPLGRHGAGPLRDGSLRIAVLDIGQGDSTLVQQGDEAVLVDVGPPEGRVVDRVHELGVDRVDGIVLTHDSLDHRGGFDAAYARLHPAWVAHPTNAPGPWRRIRERAGTLLDICAGDGFRVGRATVTVLHPRCDGTIAPRTGDLHNDGAVVLLVRFGAVTALLPADAEAPVLLDLPIPHIDLLRVSHHGSRDPMLPTLLERLRPAAAAISVGEGNDYGHPTPPTLAALRAAGVTTWRTDHDGTIVFDTDGTSLTVAS